LNSARQTYATVRSRESSRLETADIWKRLSDAQRTGLISQTPLPEADATPIATEDDLIAALRRIPLPQWRDRTDALAGRVDALLGAATKLLEPKAQRVSLPSATLHNADDLDRWISSVRTNIEAKLKEGPVIL
jgi:hypothetical protein